MENPLMKKITFVALALVACGGSVTTRRPDSDPPPPPCPVGTVTVRLVKPDPNPYTNEEFALCSMPADPELAGIVWCCPPEKP